MMLCKEVIEVSVDNVFEACLGLSRALHTHESLIHSADGISDYG